MKAVIMAGGKGTRLSAITKDEIPKPMALINEKPILEWQILKLKENGIKEICIVVGHLGHKIMEYFGIGSDFGLNIYYYMEEMALGTAGALYYIDDFIGNDYFLLIYGDVIFDINIKKMEDYHVKKKSLATLFVHPNSHPFDSDLVITDGEHRVTGFDLKDNKRDYWYNNCVNAGFYILEASLFKSIKEDMKTDLEKDIIANAVLNNQNVFAYNSSEYIKDVGTVARISQAEIDLKYGVVSFKNLSKKQKCIFIDRDGTLNILKGLIYKVEDLELESTAIDAVKLINASQYLAIVATNQPVVARGLCGLDDIYNIHNKMKTLLGNGGAYLDDILFCPHHPDKGYPEENPVFKIECSCRKPYISMIKDAEEMYNIDLSQSWIIGDTLRDMQTGKNAGLKTILVQTGDAGAQKDFAASADVVCANILEAVEFILDM